MHRRTIAVKLIFLKDSACRKTRIKTPGRVHYMHFILFIFIYLWGTLVWAIVDARVVKTQHRVFGNKNGMDCFCVTSQRIYTAMRFGGLPSSPRAVP